MATQYKNVTDKAVKQIGSVSSVARHFKFKSVQSVCNWIIKDVSVRPAPSVNSPSSY